jgi:hypothetical protein
MIKLLSMRQSYLGKTEMVMFIVHLVGHVTDCRIVTRVDSLVAQHGMLLLYWKFIMHLDKGVLIFQVYQCKIYWLNICKKKERKHWLSCSVLNDFICSLIKCVVLTYFLSLLNIVFWPQTGWQNSTCWLMRKLGVIFFCKLLVNYVAWVREILLKYCPVIGMLKYVCFILCFFVVISLVSLCQ